MKRNTPQSGPESLTDDEIKGVRKNIFVNLPLRSVQQLRERIGLSYESHHSTYGPNSENPKGYYLFGVLNEAEKATTFVMRTHESLECEDVPDSTDDQFRRATDNTLRAYIDESSLWQRKMTEALIDLIGFRKTNTDDHFRRYLILSEIVSLKNRLRDIADYYCIKNRSLVLQKDHLDKYAGDIASSLGADRYWYTNKSNQLMPLSGRFGEVLPGARVHEKLVLKTYQSSFGLQSESLHPSRSTGRADLKMKDIENQVGRVGLFVLYVISAVKDLLRIHNVKGDLKTVADFVKKNDYPAKLFKDRRRQEVGVNDFVAIEGRLCQVVRVIRGKRGCGYRSFRVRYVEPTPALQAAEDEFPSSYTTLYHRHDDIVRGVRDLLVAEGHSRPSTRLINKHLDKSILSVWSNSGDKEMAAGQTKEGLQKRGVKST